MSYRFMRIIVFFDLPTETSSDRKSSSKFRRALIKDGFIMLPESVYAKLSLNQTQTNQIVNYIKKISPEKGLVQILSITEKQFVKMEIISQKCSTNIIDNDERLLIL